MVYPEKINLESMNIIYTRVIYLLQILNYKIVYLKSLMETPLQIFSNFTFELLVHKVSLKFSLVLKDLFF